MYKTPRIAQVHKSNTQTIEANRGILAGCAFAVHYLKAIIKEDVKDENNELRDYVDDMVLFKEGDTEEEAISGLYKYLMEAKNKLTYIGHVLNDKKEQIFVQRKTGERVWHQTCPDYKGRVRQAVIDFGITLRTHHETSLNKKKRVDDTVKVVKTIQSLGLSVRDNLNIIKAAGQSRATYGAAVDPFT
eukprot:19358-Heterocapsa_arctica.AAC.1